MTSTALKRTLNMPQLAFYGVGTIVGAGIYSVIGAAAGQAGHYLWVSFLLAGTAAASTVSPLAGTVLAVTALFATSSTALISLISISRLLFGMARDGDMPKPLAKILPGRRTPWVAALVLFALACALLPLGRVEIVASISSFGILLVFIVVQAAVIRLRFTQPDLARDFRVPMNIGEVPVPAVIGIVFCAALLTRFEGIVYAVGGGFLAFGCVLHWIHRCFKRSR